VADSAAAAAGAMVTARPASAWLGSVEVYGFASRYVPDRGMPERSADGAGFLGRAAAERGGWRAHVMFWRARNYIKEEADPNYLSITRSGERYHGTRDYSEAGVFRRFTLAPSAVLDVSARVHRVEHRYEYSFRVMSIVSSLWTIR
jgi:hypothetical protein